MWHVSVAKLNSTGLIPTARWGDGVRRQALRLAFEALTGVGTGTWVESLRPACLHVRRGLSPDEIATLSTEWLAIPARDEFSEDGQMEERL